MDMSTQYVIAEIPNSNLRVVIDKGTESDVEVKFSYAGEETYVLDNSDVVTLWISNQKGTYTHSIVGERIYYNRAIFRISRDVIEDLYKKTLVDVKSTIILNADITINTSTGLVIPNSELKNTINIIIRGK